METKLTDLERGEIALKILKFKMYKEGITLRDDAKREIVNTAKQLGVDPEKLKEFFKEICQELLEKVYKQL